MKVYITNLLPYDRQVQYFNHNQYVTLSCCETMIADACSEVALVYYFKLRMDGFKVCVSKEDVMKLSDEVLKRIIKSLGVLYLPQEREELERYLIESLLSCGSGLNN